MIARAARAANRRLGRFVRDVQSLGQGFVRSVQNLLNIVLECWLFAGLTANKPQIA
jgi:hypothetical protein